MYLYNQTTGEKADIPPLDGGTPLNHFVINAVDATPRNIVPLDHTMTYVILDILLRYLEYKGYDVAYQQNIPLNDDEAWATYFKEEVTRLNIRLPEFAEFEIGLDNKNIDRTRGQANLHFYIKKDAMIENSRSKTVLVRLYKPWHTAVKSKINQSIGSLMSTRMFLERYSLNALRIYLAQHHYRDPWSYNTIGLERATRSAEKIDTAIVAISHSDGPALNPIPAKRRFLKAIEQDLNTFAATAALLNLADDILFKAPSGYNVGDAQDTLREMGAVLGLQFEPVPVI